MHELGAVLWPDLAEQYIQHCMKPDQSQMTDASQLRRLLDHFKVAEDFEAAAVKLL